VSTFKLVSLIWGVAMDHDSSFKIKEVFGTATLLLPLGIIERVALFN